jgi:peptidoglycan lytic transglycosylase D
MRMRLRTVIPLIILALLPTYVGAQTVPNFAGAPLKFHLTPPHKVAPFPLVLNEAVRSYVDSYLAHFDTLRMSYARSAPYLKQMMQMLRRYGVPADMVYLAFAESAFTKDGAGPWQLTKATARQYGLRVNDFLDERRDPIKSTRAAAEYLAKLHDDTGDWRLTVVAWNTGEGLLQHFVDTHGQDFSRLLDHLPERTRALLNRFMAVAFISENAKEYGLSDVIYTESTPYARISVPGGTPLSKVAAATHSETYEIKHLNPAILTNRIPPGGYNVVIPLDGKVTRQSEVALDGDSQAPAN